MNRKIAKLIRAFNKITNKSYRGMKKEWQKLSKEDRISSKRDLKKFYEDNLKQGLIPKNYHDLKKPLKDLLKGKESVVSPE